MDSGNWLDVERMQRERRRLSRKIHALEERAIEITRRLGEIIGGEEKEVSDRYLAQGAQKSGRPAGKSTGNLGGTVSAKAGKRTTAKREDTTRAADLATALPASVTAAGRELRVIVTLDVASDAHADLYQGVIWINSRISLDQQRRALDEAKRQVNRVGGASAA